MTSRPIPICLITYLCPYHNNETGSQNKPVLGVKGSTIPIVEGKDDVRARWTANLTTISDSCGILKGQMPPVECLFKAAVDGQVKERGCSTKHNICDDLDSSETACKEHS